MFQAAIAVALFQASNVLAGLAFPPIPADKTTPFQQRISFHGPNAVSVAWNTYEKLTKSCVQYGLHEDSLTTQTCSKHSVTYETSRTWNNLVALTGLMPATRYYYRIGSTNSTTNFFQTSRSAGDTTPFTILTLADLGIVGTDGYKVNKRSDIPYIPPALNHTTIDRMALMIDEYEFIIHPGDLGYADDWFEDSSNAANGTDAYASIIENFFGQLSPISGRVPYQVSPGNHEADCVEVGPQAVCSEYQRNFTDFQYRYDGMMPTAFTSTSKNKAAINKRKMAAKLANPPFWYSFDYGMAHIIMFNTETDFDNAPDEAVDYLDSGPFGAPNQQIEFLNADLASVDRTVTPWVIAAGHRPWYTNGDNNGVPDTSAGCAACQTAFEGLFYQYGVDAAIFGHVHNLQRFVPMYNGVIDAAGMHNPTAPMYTIIGGPGNIEGPSATTPNTTGNVFAYNADYGFGTLTFYNKTNMGIDFYNSATGDILDTSMLYKNHATQFVNNKLPSK